VKNYTGQSIAAMSSFNWIGDIPSCANPNLLKTVLREEWGFVGMVETDYNGSYGYQITDSCIRNGNDLMLGFASAPSNQLTDQSATATLAMRQACKNILYTVAKSGYYTNAEGDPTNQPDKMVSLFRNIDIGIGVGLIILELLAIAMLISGRKKRKNA